MERREIIEHSSILEVVQTQLEVILQFVPAASAPATLATSCKRLLGGMQNDLDAFLSE